MGEVISFIDKIKNLFANNQEPKEVRYLRGKPFELKKFLWQNLFNIQITVKKHMIFLTRMAR